MKRIFTNHSRAIEEEISLYLDSVLKSALIFHEGVKAFFRNKPEKLAERLQEVSRIERDADEYLEHVKYKLYAFLLIPDSRGDVFNLLDAMDDLVDAAKHVLLQLSIEKPEVVECLREDFIELGEYSFKTVDELVIGVRAFFDNTKSVEDSVNKVIFYEKEADKQEEVIKRKAFSSQEITHLSCKVHIRYFAEKIALLSDKAEDVAKSLLIYTVKRKI